MPQIKKQCVCGKEFLIYPYREKTALYCSRKCSANNIEHKSGYKCPKGALAKIGKKNPMWGKDFTEKHRKRIGQGIKKFYKENPDRKKIMSIKVSGDKNWNWVGDKIGRLGIHDWIRKEKGEAKKHKCKMEDNTCKGRLEWSNISGKYLRKLSDWQILCRSHHVRFDMTDEWKKHNITKFKKGNIPWNKKI